MKDGRGRPVKPPNVPYWKDHFVFNGVIVLDFTDPTPKSFDGYIALQLHSGGLGHMWFKDIFVRGLDKDRAPAPAPTKKK